MSLNDSYKKYNKKKPMIRMEAEVYEEVVDFCNENDLVISQFVTRGMRYIMENVEMKSITISAERPCIGDKEI